MRALVWIAAALAMAASTVACLYAIPDLATDEADAGSAGSSGSSGGGSGGEGGSESGSGGSTPEGGSTLPDGAPIMGCVDVLDVPPVSVAPISIAGISFGGAPEMARIGGVFGVAWSDEGSLDGGDTVTVHFATVTTAGAVTSSKVASAGVPLVSIAASAQYFAVASSNSTEIHRFDVSGTERLNYAILPTAGKVPYQIRLSGSPGGILVTAITEAETLQTFWLGDSADATSSAQAFPASAGMVSCCADRRWAAGFGFTPPEFAVSWIKIGGTDIVVDHVDTTGLPAASPTFVAGTGVNPRYFLPIGDHMLVGDCGALVRVGSDGTADPPVTLPADKAFACDVGVAGSRLRMARLTDDGVIRWSAPSLENGAAPTMRTFGTNVISLHVAWDGADGFGVVFSDGLAIRYAHLRMCS
jgi:hypothetical protein